MFKNPVYDRLQIRPLVFDLLERNVIDRFGYLAGFLSPLAPDRNAAFAIQIFGYPLVAQSRPTLHRNVSAAGSQLGYLLADGFDFGQLGLPVGFKLLVYGVFLLSQALFFAQKFGQLLAPVALLGIELIAD